MNESPIWRLSVYLLEKIDNCAKMIDYYHYYYYYYRYFYYCFTTTVIIITICNY